MGWRHDIQYLFAARIEDGSMDDAFALIASVPLDETCRIEIRPIRTPRDMADKNGHRYHFQPGALMKLHFETLHRQMWQSKTLDAIESMLASTQPEWQVDLFTTNGDDNEPSMQYGIMTWFNVKDSRKTAAGANNG